MRPVAILITVSRSINPYAQLLHMPSSNNHTVPEIIRPVAISMEAPSGNINIVLEIYTYTPIGCLNTVEIEEHRHKNSDHIKTVPINLTFMLSDNLNAWAINKYTNTLSDHNQIVAIW